MCHMSCIQIYRSNDQGHFPEFTESEYRTDWWFLAISDDLLFDSLMSLILTPFKNWWSSVIFVFTAWRIGSVCHFIKYSVHLLLLCNKFLLPLQFCIKGNLLNLSCTKRFTNMLRTLQVVFKRSLHCVSLQKTKRHLCRTCRLVPRWMQHYVRCAGTAPSAVGFDNYEEEYAHFSLDIPERFNFARDVIDKWAELEEVWLLSFTFYRYDYIHSLSIGMITFIHFLSIWLHSLADPYAISSISSN